MNNASAILAASDPGAGRPASAAQRGVEADAGEADARPHGLCVRAAELSPLREDAREVDFICSTEAIDSYDEILKQNWDLKRFSKNPVALWAHQSRELPIGYWKNMRVEDNALRGTLKIASAAANPVAENVFQSIKERTLRAVSVGFVPRKVSYEDRGGQEICILDDLELHEVSVVPIPACSEAIIDMKARAKAAFVAERATHQKSTPPTEAAPINTAATVADTATKAIQEGQMATENEKNEHQKSVDAAESRARTAETERVKAIEERALAVAERDSARTAEKAATDRAVVAEKAVDELRVKLLETELEPLIGVKCEPAEREGLVAVATVFAKQGEAGAAKWKTHLDAIRARADISQRTGGSVLPAEQAAGQRSLSVGANDSGGELAALVNHAAANQPALLVS
jgi:HK97 family phage prohead protease